MPAAGIGQAPQVPQAPAPMPASAQINLPPAGIPQQAPPQPQFKKGFNVWTVIGTLFVVGALVHRAYWFSDQPTTHQTAAEQKPLVVGKPTKENFQQVQVGMSRQRLIAVLGMPNIDPDGVAPGQAYSDQTREQMEKMGIKMSTEKWPYKIEGQVVLILLVDGKVQDILLDEGLRGQ